MTGAKNRVPNSFKIWTWVVGDRVCRVGETKSQKLFAIRRDPGATRVTECTTLSLCHLQKFGRDPGATRCAPDACVSTHYLLRHCGLGPENYGYGPGLNAGLAT